MGRFAVLSIVFFIGLSSWFCFKSVKSSFDHKQANAQYAQILNFEDRLLNAREWLIPFWEVNPKMLRAKSTKRTSVIFESEMNLWAMFEGALIVVFILGMLYEGIRKNEISKYLAIGLSVSSLPLLVMGMLLPALEVAAFSNDLKIPIQGEVLGVSVDLSKTFHGRTYYFFQEKSTADALILLFTKGNVIVATALFIFSLIIPGIKLWAAWSLSVFNSEKLKGWIRFVATHLGKWSMADVFFVAMLLSYFSFSSMISGVESDVNAKVGLYAFGAFVIFSKFGYDLSLNQQQANK